MTTLTYHPDQGQPEFSEEELNSIQVGEQMEQEQQRGLVQKLCERTRKEERERRDKALQLHQRWDAVPVG